MFTRRSILSRPTYWLTENRMDFMRAVEEYMNAHQLNRRQLAEHLKCSPSYVSQILNGDTNLSMEKLYEIALAIGKVPITKYEDLDVVLHRDAIQCDTPYETTSTKSDSVHLVRKKPTHQFSITERLVEA
jgi:transcriptional regulator with XRE-family HTH domain